MGVCCPNRVIDADVRTCVELKEVISVLQYYLQEYQKEVEEINKYLEHPATYQFKKKTLRVINNNFYF
ncbi:MAG: hypothetical protein MJ252_08440 [archaeon]|nr:hypothetical protein [archaeon]